MWDACALTSGLRGPELLEQGPEAGHPGEVHARQAPPHPARHEGADTLAPPACLVLGGLV